MSKITVAVGSFIAGIASVLLFLMLSGSHTSTLAQAVVNSGAEPSVPSLLGNVFTGAQISGGTQPLDGFECDGCTFKDVTFTYAGGAARITNPKFSGATRLVLKGAAANTAVTVS